MALTIAAHAAVLALPMRPASARGEGPPSGVIEVRTIAPRPVAPVLQLASTAPEAVALTSRIGAQHAPDAHDEGASSRAPSPPKTVAIDKPAPAAPEVEARASASARDSSASALAAPDSPAAASARDSGTSATAPAATHPGLALPGPAGEDDAFLARSLLSLPPQPLAPVIIPDVDTVGPGEHYRGELTLFIDETGAVVRVRSETDELPAALEDAARRAFMAVRFAPGELADMGAVKSRIRVEVVFDGGSPQS